MYAAYSFWVQYQKSVRLCFFSILSNSLNPASDCHECTPSVMCATESFSWAASAFDTPFTKRSSLGFLSLILNKCDDSNDPFGREYFSSLSLQSAA